MDQTVFTEFPLESDSTRDSRVESGVAFLFATREEGGFELAMFYLVMLIIVTIVGNIGNTMVIGAVLSDKKLRRTTSIFIVNLAVADLCVNVFVEPSNIAGVFTSHRFWADHDGLCHVIGSICIVSCFCSLWSIAGISLNRYFLICRQVAYRNIFTLRNTLLLALIPWVGGILIDLPNFLGWGDHAYDMKTRGCSYDRLASYSYTVFYIAVFVVVPLFTVLFCNAKIYLYVKQCKARVAAHSSGSSTLLTSVSGSQRQGNPIQTVSNQVEESVSGNATATSSKTMLSVPTNVIGSTQTPSHNNDQQKPKQQRQQQNTPNNSNLEKHPQSSSNKHPEKSEEKIPGAASFRSPGFSHLGNDEAYIKPKQPHQLANSKGLQPVAKQEIKLAKTLFIVFSVFCLCWAPYGVLCLVDRGDTVAKEAYLVAILMAHTSSSINSVLYAATNRQFRDGYRLFLRKCGFKCF